jgi:hypothetical protein
MKNLLAYDSKECLFNFIDLASQVYRKKYSLTSLMRDLRSEDSRLVCYFSKWRQRCMEHYEASLLYSNQPDTLKSIQKQTLLKTRYLLENKEYFEPHVPQTLTVNSAEEDEDSESDTESESDADDADTESESPVPIQQSILRVTNNAEQLLLPLLSTMSTAELSNLLFPLTLPTSALPLLGIPGLVSIPPPAVPILTAPVPLVMGASAPVVVAPPAPTATQPQSQRQTQEDQDAMAMNMFLNLLLDMGDANIGDFLPN